MPNKIKTFGTTTKRAATRNVNFKIGVDGSDDYGPTSSTGFYNGITPPSSGYTIYVHRNIGGPSIHVAYDDSQCIFFLKSFGSTGNTISEVLSWSTGRTDLWVQTNDLTSVDLDPIVYSYNSGTTLTWPSNSVGYTLLSTTFTNNDDGYSNTAISLPTSFATNNQFSTSLRISTNGYFTLGTGSGNVLTGPTQSNPASMCANPGDLHLQPGLNNSDGDTHNVYYITGTTEYWGYYVKLLVYCGTYQATTTAKSWMANFYRDSSYQWFETRAKSNVTGNAGPYNTISVAQTSSTTSRVWRGDLNGQNWVYMGTGSVG